MKTQAALTPSLLRAQMTKLTDLRVIKQTKTSNKPGG